MARTVAAIHAELVLDAAEISKTEGGNVFVEAWIASEHWELGWWFCGLTGSPDNVRRFDVGVWQMVD